MLLVSTAAWSHDFAPGALTVVLGRNGAGKTSLVRAIAGLPSSMPVDVVLNGDPLGDRPPRRRGVALVFQEFINYPSLTVFENIASPLRARRLKADAVDRRVHDLAARLGLADLLARLPDALSGGQQQRVAIARALARDAAVLMLDEPFVNLDLKLREQLGGELRRLLVAEHTSVIYTSADPKEALGLGDEVVLLAGGRVLQTGRPIDVLKRPVSTAAADLMCEPGINLVPVTVDGRRISASGVEIALPERLAEVRGDRLLALRPDQLTLANAAADVRATVQLTETNGSQTHVHAEVAGCDWVVTLPGLHRFEIGERLALRVDAAGMNLFDADGVVAARG